MKCCVFYVLLLLLSVCCIPKNTSAQLLPIHQPEQDACNALVLCGGSFSSPYSYQGLGFINNLATTPCGAGEANSVWLKLTATTSGIMVFTITPVSPQDDYDFAVLNVTNTACSNIGQGNVIRCNFNDNTPGSNVNGVIGLNTTSTVNSVAGGTFGSSFCQQVSVTAGQVFLIMINNFGNYQTGGPSSGFTINFAGSTATFNNPPVPQLDSVLSPECNYNNEVTIKLNTEVKCSSIAANGSDFSISPAGTISSAQGVNCNGTLGYTDRIKLTFTAPLAPGAHTVNAQQGSDGNTLLDLCNNAMPLPRSVSFVVKDLAKTVSLTKCQNELPFIWNGITVTSGGPAAAIARTVTSKGCDSFTTLNLTILPSYSGVQNISICSNRLPYIWNGITVNSGGANAAVYRGRRTTGCDSLITLNLTLLPVYTGSVTVNVCIAQMPYTWNGHVIAAGGNGVATYTGTRVNGCDSTVSLNLIVRPNYNTTDVVNTCANRLPYTWNGIVVSSGGNGVATYHTVSRFGCDSVVSLNLNVGSVKNTTVNQTICSSQLPYTWNGKIVTTGGNAVANYTTLSSYGCDSVVTLNLTVKSIYSGVVSKIICTNNLPYLWNGITVTAGGNAAATFRGTGVGGCDSIIVLNLTVLPATTNQVNMRKCARELPFVWNGFTITNGGTAVATYVTVSVNGCDSTVKLNLSVFQPTAVSQIMEGCDLVTFKGINYTASQVVHDTLYYRGGCDSIYRTTNINVYKTDLTAVTKDTMGCGFLYFNQITYSRDTAINRKFLDIHGCDSLLLTTRITIHPNNPTALVLDRTACDSLLFENAYYSTDTTIRDVLKTQWGCDSVLRTVRIQVEHFQLSLTANEPLIVNGEVVWLTTSGNHPYHTVEWSPMTLFSDQALMQQQIRPTKTESYQVIAKTDLGCTDTATVKVIVDTLIADAFMPNAFTPNGDGLNDYFSPTFYSKRGYVIEAFMIFNRWGEKVYTGHGTNVKWDGTYNTKPADMGTYFYTIIISFANGAQKSVKGTVELLR